LAYAGMQSPESKRSATDTTADSKYDVPDHDESEAVDENGESIFQVAMAKKRSKVLKRTKTPKELQKVESDTMRMLSQKKFFRCETAGRKTITDPQAIC